MSRFNVIYGYQNYSKYPFPSENLLNLPSFFNLDKSKQMDEMIKKIKSITQLKQRAESYGLSIVTTSWNDCSRFNESNWGNCVADLNIRVDNFNMPIVKKPNFADITCDRRIDDFKVTVGNQIPKDDDVEVIDPLKKNTIKRIFRKYKYLY